MKDIYGTEVSPQFITTVTDAVSDRVEAWRNRELESVYPIVFFDAIVVKIRENGHVANRRAKRSFWACGRPTARERSTGLRS